MQQGHAITWNEFKQAFKSHHIPKGLMDRKMRELLALRQGSDTMYHYAQKFNSMADITWIPMQKRLKCSVIAWMVSCTND
jgi:hypothetical protein